MKIILQKKIVLFFMLIFIKVNIYSYSWNILMKSNTSKPTVASSTKKDSIEPIVFNPSLLSLLSKRTFSFLVEYGKLEDLFLSLNYAQPIYRIKNSVVGCGLLYYDGGTTEVSFIENGVEKIKKISILKESLFHLNFSYYTTNKVFLFGTNLKAASSIIAEKKAAYSFSSDFSFSFLPNKKSILSLNFKNIGFSTKYDENDVELPFYINFISNYEFCYIDFYLRPGICLDYVISQKKLLPSFSLDFEKKPINLFFGYTFIVDDINLILGFMIDFKNYSISYSWAPSKYFNSSHKLFISYRF
ncbi:MAG: hypothetical protein ABDH23_06720 [Endomicrobiia bacterium]